MNLADDLDYINSLQDRQFNVPRNNNLSVTPTVGQSAFHSAADATFAPFQNAQNNFTKTISDFQNPQGSVLKAGLTDATDLYNLKHNTFGGQSSRQYTMPTLDDQHLEAPNEQGLRKVKDSGHTILQDHANNFGIEDNSALLSGTPGTTLGQPLTPTTAVGNKPSMLGGAVKDEAVASVAGDSGILGDVLALL